MAKRNFSRAEGKIPQLRTLLLKPILDLDQRDSGDSVKQKDCMQFPQPGRIAAGPAGPLGFPATTRRSLWADG
jgi:hypothetical protein